MKPKIIARSLRRWRLLVLAVLGLALAACTGIRSAVATPTVQVALTQTATRIPTRYVTPTPSVTATQLPTPTSLPTATATPVVRQYEITIEPGLSSDAKLEGVLVVTGNDGNNYLLDLHNMRRQLLPPGTPGSTFVLDWAGQTISPDRKQLAYIERVASGSKLHLVTSDGQQQPVRDWPDNQLWEPIGWLDNHRLSLVSAEGDDGAVTVLDTLTGDAQEITPTFPAVSPNGTLLGFDDSVIPFVIYDPTLTRAVFKRYLRSQDRSSYELWDVQATKMLWERFVRGYESRPIWAPDGKRFAVIYNQESEKLDPIMPHAALYLIDRNGQEILLADFVIGDLAWSPDGHFIATWWGHPLYMGNPSPLAIVDVTGKESTVFEFSNGFTSITYPIWSPDGQWIAFNGYVGESVPDDAPNSVIVLNIAQRRAFEIVKDVLVSGWMAATP
jgi:WD40 repeat protein